jgi:hypothetical protein
MKDGPSMGKLKKIKSIMDGAWMCFAWGHMEHVCMGSKLKTLHVLLGGMFWVLDYPCIKTCFELPTKIYHVSMGGKFQCLGFQGMCFEVGRF